MKLFALPGEAGACYGGAYRVGLVMNKSLLKDTIVSLAGEARREDALLIVGL